MHISAPGKLMLPGEWAVLEVGNPCIVAAVNRRSHANIEKSDKIRIVLKDYDIDLTASYDGKQLIFKSIDEKQKEKIIFIKGAIEAALAFLGKSSAFKITTRNDDTEIIVDGQQKKIGFGTSAAAVVAVVSAILTFNGFDISQRKNKDIIYKLSAIAHFFAQGKVGSAFDVAASTYGGAVLYRRFDSKWLSEEMQSKSVKEIAEEHWPHFSAENLPIPEGFVMLIGWTKESASTSAMIKQMDAFKISEAAEYKRIYDEIANLLKDLVPAWRVGEEKDIFYLINKNELLLRELTEKSGVPIETADLRKLSEIAARHGAGKLSGAGGGDCGIAICFSEANAEKIKEEWKKAGLYIVDAEIDEEGVRAEA
ncbi:MAG TPA: phosphomevalonate kinase [archaeon]|nr:phosphomevalonate kinase [archaeon]